MSTSPFRFAAIATALCGALASAAAPALANPENRNYTLGEETLSETFDRVITYNSRDSFSYYNYGGQFNTVFGAGLVRDGRGIYPENAIEQDAQNVHVLYLDAMRQQTQGDPLIRTRDLPSPYGTSVRAELRDGIIVVPAATPSPF